MKHLFPVIIVERDLLHFRIIKEMNHLHFLIEIGLFLDESTENSPILVSIGVTEAASIEQHLPTTNHLVQSLVKIPL